MCNICGVFNDWFSFSHYVFDLSNAIYVYDTYDIYTHECICVDR